MSPSSSSSLSCGQKNRSDINTLAELYEATGANQDDLSKGGIDGKTNISHNYWHNGGVLSEVSSLFLSIHYCCHFHYRYHMYVCMYVCMYM